MLSHRMTPSKWINWSISRREEKNHIYNSYKLFIDIIKCRMEWLKEELLSESWLSKEKAYSPFVDHFLKVVLSI